MEKCKGLGVGNALQQFCLLFPSFSARMSLFWQGEQRDGELTANDRTHERAIDSSKVPLVTLHSRAA